VVCGVGIVDWGLVSGFFVFWGGAILELSGLKLPESARFWVILLVFGIFEEAFFSFGRDFGWFACRFCAVVSFLFLEFFNIH